MSMSCRCFIYGGEGMFCGWYWWCWLCFLCLSMFLLFSLSLFFDEGWGVMGLGWFCRGGIMTGVGDV